jgi:hypothetical protein
MQIIVDYSLHFVEDSMQDKAGHISRFYFAFTLIKRKFFRRSIVHKMWVLLTTKKS